MEPSAELTAPVDPVTYLVDREREAYLSFLGKIRQGGSATFPLAPAQAANMFELFLQGRSLEDIRQRNQTFGLGQIAHAAVEGRWHERRASHLDMLLVETQQRTAQVALEGAKFLSDSLAATHRVQGAKVLDVLETGAGESAFVAQTPRQYKEILDNLKSITGQDKPRGNVPADVPPPPVVLPQAQAGQLVDPAKRLAELAAEQKKKRARQR